MVCAVFIFMLVPLHVLAQAPPCSYTDETSGVKYDFTKLSTSDFSTTAGGYTYNLRVCGTSEQKCPNDPDQITTGMAVQTKNTGGFGSNCYVLGQYDSSVTSANWAALDGGKGVSLTLANGSPSDCPEGTPRAVQVNFECAAAEVDNSFTIDNTDCEYTFHYKTCYACAKGCGGGGGGGGSPSHSEMTFFEIFFIIFVSSLSVYCIGGVVFNVYKYEKKGTEAIPNRGFWSAVPGYVKDGFVFTGESVGLVKKSADATEYFKAGDDAESYQGEPDGSTFSSAQLTAVLHSGDQPDLFHIIIK